MLVLCGNAGAGEVTFEDLNLAAETYYDGSDGAGGFTSSGVHFNTFFDDSMGFDYWEGFSYSNTTDTTTEGYTNDSSAIVGSGKDNSTIYGVGYQGFIGSVPTITFENEGPVTGCYITNTTYAYLAMRDSYFNAKKFGGDTGIDPDWFLLTITGKDAGGNETGTVAFYLADFRFDDNTKDYIVDDWTPVVLTSLGAVKTLEFMMTSSDTNPDPDIGMNTPAYFAIDNINDQDDDGDGYSEVEGDCDDNNPDIYPDANDICGDGIDQDCSGSDLICTVAGDDDDNLLEGCFINVSEGALQF